MEEQQVEREVMAPDLRWVFGADVAEVATKFGEESSEIPQQRAVQVRFGMLARQGRELEKVRRASSTR